MCQTEFMHKNDQDPKATKAVVLGADVDLTAVFRKWRIDDKQ